MGHPRHNLGEIFRGEMGGPPACQGNLTSKSVPEGNQFTGVTGYDTWNYTYNSFGEGFDCN